MFINELHYSLFMCIYLMQTKLTDTYINSIIYYLYKNDILSADVINFFMGNQIRFSLIFYDFDFTF